MIISKTPFRVSFFGGGTDYPVWFHENGGAALSTTIDKYCYISCRYLPPFFDYRHRIVYSKTEQITEIDDIDHPAVREVFRFMDLKRGVEIHHDGDLPARTGLGSSSSFTVGLLHTLYALNGRMVTKDQLAKEAIYVEQGMIKENVGSQDQIAAAFGGFNKIIFHRDGSFSVNPLFLTNNKLKELQDHLMLFFTGFSRNASDIAGEQIKKTPLKKRELHRMHEMVDQAISILGNDNTDICDFGRLLHESWTIKRGLTDRITTSHIDEIYEAAYSAGALGGKLLGAGGGGFMVIFAKPENQDLIKEKLSDLLLVPFQFETSGSQIIIYQPNLSYCIDDYCT